MIGPHAAALTYTLLVVPLAACQGTAEAQLAAETRRIGVFAPGSASGTDQFLSTLNNAGSRASPFTPGEWADQAAQD